MKEPYSPQTHNQEFHINTTALRLGRLEQGSAPEEAIQHAEAELVVTRYLKELKERPKGRKRGAVGGAEGGGPVRWEGGKGAG